MKHKFLSFFLIVFLVLTPLTFLQLAYAPVIPEAYVYCNNYVAGSWTNPTYAYNNNTADGATISWSATGYCAYLTLNLSSTARGSKIQYWVKRSNTVITTMQIDIANATGSWVNVFSATPTYGAYGNATITFSQYSAMRFRFSKTGTASRTATVCETQAVNNSYTVPNYLIDFTQSDSVFRIPYFTFPYGSVSISNEPNGVELNLTLPTQPASSTFAIKFEYANLSFNYQGPLNEELNVSEYTFVNATHAFNGSDLLEYRPENIVGSYAVYGLHEGNQYASGKVFHIYRPLIVDNNGATTWGILGINLLNATNGILAIATNQTWLNSASYPLVIDPTFGYTSIGGSVVNRYGDEVIVGKFSCTEVGTATMVSVYMAAASGTTEAKGLIYVFSGGALLCASAEVSGITTTASWVNFTVTGSLTATAYYIGVMADDNFNVYRDNVWDVTQSIAKNATSTYPTPPNPATFTSIYNEKLSVFVTYTTGGGPTAYTVDLTKTFTVGLTKAEQMAFHIITSQAITASLVFNALTSYNIILSQGTTLGLTSLMTLGYNINLALSTTLAMTQQFATAFNLILSAPINTGILTSILTNYNLILTQGTTLGLNSLTSLVYYVTLTYATTLTLIDYLQTNFNVILTQSFNSGFLFTALTNYNLILTQLTTIGLSQFAALAYYVTLSLSPNLAMLQHLQTTFNVILSQTINPTLTTLIHTAFNVMLQSTWTTGLISYAVNTTTITAYIVDLALTTTLTMTQLFRTAFNLFLSGTFQFELDLPALYPGIPSIPGTPTKPGGGAWITTTPGKAIVGTIIVCIIIISLLGYAKTKDEEGRDKHGKRRRRPTFRKKPRLEPRRKFPQPERKFPQPKET